jgi:hypothetical protein
MCCPRWQALPAPRVLDFLRQSERTRG